MGSVAVTVVLAASSFALTIVFEKHHSRVVVVISPSHWGCIWSVALHNFSISQLSIPRVDLPLIIQTWGATALRLNPKP